MIVYFKYVFNSIFFYKVGYNWNNYIASIHALFRDTWNLQIQILRYLT